MPTFHPLHLGVCQLPHTPQDPNLHCCPPSPPFPHGSSRLYSSEPNLSVSRAASLSYGRKVTVMVTDKFQGKAKSFPDWLSAGRQ